MILRTEDRIREQEEALQRAKDYLQRLKKENDNAKV